MALGYRINAKAGDRAEILIYEDVGEGWFGGVSAKQFAGDLKSMGEVKAIDVRINSYGGDVFDGLAIYRQLADHKARVVVHIDGVAASIASVIAMAGDEINIAAPAFLMIHNAWGMAVGSPEDMRSVADRLEAVSGAIADVYTARTKNPSADVRAWMDEERWFTAAEAMEAGFVTRVVDNVERMAASFNPQLHKFKGMPAALVAPVTEVTPLRNEAAETFKRMQARHHAARMRSAVKRT